MLSFGIPRSSRGRLLMIAGITIPTGFVLTLLPTLLSLGLRPQGTVPIALPLVFVEIVTVAGDMFNVTTFRWHLAGLLVDWALASLVVYLIYWAVWGGRLRE